MPDCMSPAFAGAGCSSPTEAGRDKSLEDNYRAVDEAAALQADSLVLVVGASPEGSNRRCQKPGNQVTVPQFAQFARSTKLPTKLPRNSYAPIAPR